MSDTAEVYEFIGKIRKINRSSFEPVFHNNGYYPIQIGIYRYLRCMQAKKELEEKFKEIQWQGK